jgi:hypothetical protein
MASRLLWILGVVRVDLMMFVVHHQLKTFDLKANLDQPCIFIVGFTTFAFC